MKKILFLLLALFPLLGSAKDKKDDINPKYLAGAITMDEDGKISFSKEIKVPSLSRNELYDILLNWADERYQPNGKLMSRVVYTDKEKGDIAVSAEEYIVFSSNALSLDRTRIYYQLFIKASDKLCDLKMTRIRYWYDENRDGGQKYTAEEWISDDMALNKKKTKLAPICGKFRRETINLKDDIFNSVADVIGRHTLLNETAAPAVSPAPIQQTTVTAVPVAASDDATLRTVTIQQLPANLNEIAAKGRITLTANDEEVEINPESWGGFGKLFSKDVTYILIDQSKIAVSTLIEHTDHYTVSFYQSGSTVPSVVITCKKSMSNEMTADELKSLNQSIDASKTYRMYIGEITGMQMRL